jgi:hypothetical protein
MRSTLSLTIFWEGVISFIENMEHVCVTYGFYWIDENENQIFSRSFKRSPPITNFAKIYLIVSDTKHATKCFFLRNDHSVCFQRV